MRRREFLEKAGCGAAGFVAFSDPAIAGEEGKELVVNRYDMEIEVVEIGPKTRCHKKGETFKYPQETGKICFWLISALDPFCATLNNGGILPGSMRATLMKKSSVPRGSLRSLFAFPTLPNPGSLSRSPGPSGTRGRSRSDLIVRKASSHPNSGRTESGTAVFLTPGSLR